MGYSTDYDGVLKFKKELTSRALGKLNTILGEDCRDHPEWDCGGLTYIDLELTKDFSGIQWNGSEKSYEMVEKVNFVIELMRKDFPDFALEGQFHCNGEDSSDVWELIMEDNGITAFEKEMVFTSPQVRCPHCDEVFHVEQSEEV